MCNALDLEVKSEYKSYNGSFYLFRDILKQAVESNKLSNVFQYCVSKRYIYKHLNVEEQVDFLFLSPKEMSIKLEELRKNKINQVIQRLNSILFVDDYEASFDFSKNQFVFTSTEQNLITVNSNVMMNFNRLEELYDNAQKSLRNMDYDSVLTKSRTIIEQTFLYILQSHKIDIKENGKIMQYRSKVNEVLGLKPNGENWKDSLSDELRPIKVLISGINKVTDSISDMRDNNSDSHGSLKRFTNRKAEAELCLNAAITVSSYYLRVNQRENANN